MWLVLSLSFIVCVEALNETAVASVWLATPQESTLNKRLIGRVQDKDGNPVANADLYFQRNTQQEPVHTRSDAEGDFQLEITFEAGQRHYGHLWCVAPTFCLKCVFPIAANWEGKPCLIRLIPEESIKLQTVDPKGNAKSSVRVKPYQYQVPNGVYESDEATGLIGIIPDQVGDHLAAYSDTDGVVTLRGIEVKHLDRIHVQQGIAVPQSVPWTRSHPTLVIHPVGRVEGQLQGGDPSDYSRWSVFVIAQQGEDWLRHDATAFVPIAENGAFQVDGLMVGKLKFQMMRKDQEACPAYLAVIPATPALASGQTVRIAIPMRRGVTLRGSVYLEDTRQPVVHARVSIQTSSRSQSVFTDTKGEYRISVLPGLCHIQVLQFQRTENPYDYPPLQSITIPGGSVEFVAPEMLMAPYAAREVEVLDAAGNAVKSRYVYLVDMEFGHVLARGKLDQDGIGVLRFPRDEMDAFDASTSSWRLGEAEQDMSVDRRRLPQLEVLHRESSDDDRLVLVWNSKES